MAPAVAHRRRQRLWRSKSGSPGRSFGKNKYLYNGKELNADYEINLYEYGARWYGPAVGRFTGVDPIAEEFPHLSVYNYASNDPVGNIDLHGLQGVPYVVGEILNRVENVFAPVKEKYDAIKATGKTQKRAQLVTKGTGNVVFGVLGTLGAVALALESGGASGVAIPFTLGEVSIGAAQIVDGFFGDADPNSNLHNTGSIPGLVTAQAGGSSEAVQLADAIGQFTPGILTGGNILGGAKDAAQAVKSLSKGNIKEGMTQAAQAYDAFNDTKGVIEAAEVYRERGKGEMLSEKEVMEIKRFINGQ